QSMQSTLLHSPLARYGFVFPTHGDSILSKINALREEQRFYDITLLLRGPRGAAVQPLHFHGHRAVLAGSSDFLRDQFLLHEGRAELSVGVVSRVEVGKRLLLSCYTGLLEVRYNDLITASALMMSQVVDRCSQAISQYFGPTLAFLKPERHLEEKDTQQPHSDQTVYKLQKSGGKGCSPVQHQHPRRSLRKKETCSLLTQTSHPIKFTMLQFPEPRGRSRGRAKNLESYVGHLKQHRRYLCLVCGKGFSQRINLARHLRVHTGVKPFRCLLCHKTFPQKATLQDHFNLHTGDKPHKCLRRHLKDIHCKSSLRLAIINFKRQF
uniref:Zinc finger and BTB domain containing 26 n=1 Tax=Cyclopterus lumpus TaxID=8103 RepID=A0A8C2ZFQ8_CYCLU